MSGMDVVNFTTLERALSSDINNLESDQQRAILETLRFMFEKRTPVAGTFGTRTNRSLVVGGLNVTPSGDDVSIGPGVIVQESATLPPAPGTLDSTYRWAWNRTATVVTMPAPGGTTFYVVEAQMIEVVALATVRDVYNPGLGVFVPTLVDKLLERQLDFQVTAGAGSNYPALTGGDWIPVCGVRRPGGGGAVAASDIDDLRVLWNALSFPQSEGTSRIGISPTVKTTHEPGAAASNLLLVTGAAYPPVSVPGVQLFFGESAAEDWTGATFKDPTLGAFAANAWYYLYVCPWQGLAPSGYYANANGHRGIVVLTDVAPIAAGTPYNGAVVNLPTPWGVATVAVGAAYCMGAVQRNNANTGWAFQTPIGGGWHVNEDESVAGLASFAPPIVGNNAVVLTGKIPINADAIRVQIQWTAGAAGALSILAKKTGGSATAALNFNVPSKNDIDGNAALDLPLALIGATGFDIVVATTAPATLVAVLAGFHYPSP